jgi:hypothetical protein
MVGRDYLTRQAATLLKLARLVKDPKLAAGLTQKAADLQARSVDTSPVPDARLSARDVQTQP